MNDNTTPLLPAWATEDDMNQAAAAIAFEANMYRRAYDMRVTAESERLIDEASAYLRHEAEGW